MKLQNLEEEITNRACSQDCCLLRKSNHLGGNLRKKRKNVSSENRFRSRSASSTPSGH